MYKKLARKLALPAMLYLSLVVALFAGAYQVLGMVDALETGFGRWVTAVGAILCAGIFLFGLTRWVWEAWTQEAHRFFDSVVGGALMRGPRGHRAVLMHWRYARMDAASQEVFATLLTDANKDYAVPLDLREMLNAARSLTRETL